MEFRKLEIEKKGDGYKRVSIKVLSEDGKKCTEIYRTGVSLKGLVE